LTSRPGASIDLNADIGEHDGEGYDSDDALLGVVSSASIACGAHAGSPEVMERTAAAAAERKVAIGAHPSYPDRDGFGRREISIDPPALAASLANQISALRDCCARTGATLRYVKPHGALYNRAARDEKLARLVAACVRDVDPSLAVLALSGSALEAECRSAGLSVAREGFIDRGYLAEGSLAPRDQPGAILHDIELAAARALAIASGDDIETLDGATINIDADSLCVHGDNRNALAMVTRARTLLQAAGFAIQPFA
jgi:UPF0271 protein